MEADGTIKSSAQGKLFFCKSLGLKLPDWDGKNFIHDRLYIEDVGYRPEKIVQTKRLGIPPKGRDEHLEYRFVDFNHADSATSNPLTKRIKDFKIHSLLV